MNVFVWKWRRQTARWLKLDALSVRTSKLAILYLLVYFRLIVLWHSSTFLTVVKMLWGKKLDYQGKSSQSWWLAASSTVESDDKVCTTFFSLIFVLHVCRFYLTMVCPVLVFTAQQDILMVFQKYYFPDSCVVVK